MGDGRDGASGWGRPIRGDSYGAMDLKECEIGGAARLDGQNVQQPVSQYHSRFREI
jgi:hypothetical protein